MKKIEMSFLAAFIFLLSISSFSSETENHILESVEAWSLQKDFSESFLQIQENEDVCQLEEVDLAQLNGCEILEGLPAPPIFEIVDAEGEHLEDPQYKFVDQILNEGGENLAVFNEKAPAYRREGYYFPNDEAMTKVNPRSLGKELAGDRYSNTTKALLGSDSVEGNASYQELLENGHAKALPKGSVVLASEANLGDSDLIQVRVSSVSTKFDSRKSTEVGSKYGLFSDHFIPFLAQEGDSGYMYRKHLQQITGETYVVLKSSILLKNLEGVEEIDAVVLSLSKDPTQAESFQALRCGQRMKPLFNRVEEGVRLEKIYTLTESCFQFSQQVDLVQGKTPPEKIDKMLQVINRDYPEGGGVVFSDLKFTETGGVVVPHLALPSLEEQRSPVKISTAPIDHSSQRVMPDKKGSGVKGVHKLEAFGPEGKNMHYPRYIFFNSGSSEFNKRLDREMPSLESYCLFEKMINVWERVCAEIVVPFYLRKSKLSGSPPLSVLASSRDAQNNFVKPPWLKLDADLVKDEKLKKDVLRYQDLYPKTLAFCTLQLNDFNFVSNFAKLDQEGEVSREISLDSLKHKTHFSAIDVRPFRLDLFAFGNQLDEVERGESLLSVFHDMGVVNTYTNFRSTPSYAEKNIKTLLSHRDHHHIALPTKEEFFAGKLEERFQLSNPDFGDGFARSLYESLNKREIDLEEQSYGVSSETSKAYVDTEGSSAQSFPKQISSHYQRIFKEEWGYDPNTQKIGAKGPRECFSLGVK